jgi:hypothetical protein
MAAPDVVAYAATVAAARGVYVEAVMLYWHARAGRSYHVRELFDGMPVKNVVTWTCMLSGYTCAGRVTEATSCLMMPPVRTMAMMQWYAPNGMLKEAKELSDRMTERSVVAHNDNRQ